MTSNNFDTICLTTLNNFYLVCLITLNNFDPMCLIIYNQITLIQFLLIHKYFDSICSTIYRKI